MNCYSSLIQIYFQTQNFNILAFTYAKPFEFQSVKQTNKQTNKETQSSITTKPKNTIRENLK